jgi:Asp-tRNA(Asn)/Glu-tRNA(Gln) amidotransferase A subunit family amidase
MNRSRNSRRSFLKAASTAAACAPFINLLPRADAQARKFDPSFGGATEAVKALRNGVISSRELTAHVFKCIAKYNPKINAFVTRSGLPVGIQIMGPYLEDATPIDIALKLTQSIGGFTSPRYNDV